MPHGDIPNMLGRVLSGTKYGVKQTRGKFGLGAKMALIWSKMSTGLPVQILSARKGQSFVSYYKLDIDIHKCGTRVVYHTVFGSEIQFKPLISCAARQPCECPHISSSGVDLVALFHFADGFS